jgi:hypothetical protein
MIGIGHFDAIGRDRRVADELAAEQVHEQRRPARRIPQAGVGAIRQQAQHGVGAVQGIPAATARQPGLERFLRRQRRGDVAGIGDQDIGRLDRGDVLVILEHAGAHGGIIGQELEQFEAGQSRYRATPRRRSARNRSGGGGRLAASRSRIGSVAAFGDAEIAIQRLLELADADFLVVAQLHFAGLGGVGPSWT